MELTNQTFGEWKVLEKAEPIVYTDGQKVQRWKCKCSCGEVKLVRQGDLRNGKSTSCGCINGIKQAKTQYKKEYICWEGMKSRCNNPNNMAYPQYGGRGITYTSDWETFAGFIKDVGVAPSKNHVIDRINVDGNYEPTNVRWVDRDISAFNRGSMKNNTSGYKGVHYNKRQKKYVAYLSYKKVKYNLGVFNTAEEAANARLEKIKELELGDYTYGN